MQIAASASVIDSDKLRIAAQENTSSSSWRRSSRLRRAPLFIQFLPELANGFCECNVWLAMI
jgi:hypothetical protein